MAIYLLTMHYYIYIFNYYYKLNIIDTLIIYFKLKILIYINL